MPITTIAVIATPGFSPFHLSIPSLVFNGVLYDEKAFEVFICAESAGMVASDGVFFVEAKYGLALLKQVDIVIVPYWGNPNVQPSSVLLDAIRQAYRAGKKIVGLCLGVYVLAYAGLLNGLKASTHWKFEKDFMARFPDVFLNANALYVEDNRLITSAGTAAAIDCCLYLVRQQCGSRVANHVARRMVVPPYRDGDQAQFIELPVPKTTKDQRMNKLLDYLRENLSQPHTLDSLAQDVAMSRRSFSRHFLRATGVSVGEWLMAERLKHSQELLESSRHSIEKISEIAGFMSAITFRQQFKNRFSVSPMAWRKTFKGDGDYY